MFDFNTLLTILITVCVTVIICALFGFLMIEADKHQHTLINRTRDTDIDPHDPDWRE